jgi:hypothetical protein
MAAVANLGFAVGGFRCGGGRTSLLANLGTNLFDKSTPIRYY